MMSDLLRNKVAIVTGAASGIGRAIALQLGEQGARLVLADVDDAGGERVLQLLRERDVPALYRHADTSRPDDEEALVQDAIKSFGGLDIAVNNAGIAGPIAPLAEYPLDGWDRVIAVNLSGVFYGMRHQIPAMRARGGGSIVNISSILGNVGFRNSGAYAAAKHGLVGLTQTAALECGLDKIRVNAVAPGFIRTPMVETNLPAEALTTIASLHALGRLGTSEEVASLVTWLASDAASFVTGAYLPIDGGYLAQ